MKRNAILLVSTVLLIVAIAIGYGEYLRWKIRRAHRGPIGSIDHLRVPINTEKEQQQLLNQLEKDPDKCKDWEQLVDLAEKGKDFTLLQKWLTHYKSRQNTQQGELSKANLPCIILLESCIARAKGKYSQALALVERGLKAFPDNADLLQQAADLSYLMQSFERAYVLGQKVVDRLTGEKSPKKLAKAYGNLALYTFQTEGLKRAVEYQNKAIEIHKQLNDDAELMKDYFNRGAFFLRRGIIEDAERDLRKALTLALQLKDIPMECRIRFLLIGVYKSMDNTQLEKLNIRRYQTIYTSALRKFKQYQESQKK